MGDHLAWLWRVLPVLWSFAKKLWDLLPKRNDRPFRKRDKGRIAVRKGDLEIEWDWDNRHDQD